VQKQPETPKKQRNRSSRPPLQSNYKARTGRDSERGTAQATEFIKYLVTPRIDIVSLKIHQLVQQQEQKVKA